MSNEQFVGAWNLVSFESWVSDGETTYPFGRDAEGTLIYEAGGIFSAQVMQKGRPEFESGDLLNGTVGEISSAYKGYIAYFGTYVVDEAEGIMTHHVRGSLFPNFVSGTQTRYFKFTDGQMTLSTPALPFGGQSVSAVLVWERAS